MRLDTGKILNNRYRIVSLLGQGGFGAVYRAWDLNLKRPCAVKENLETNPQGQKQFENEATILANLYHLNLPRVIDHFVLPDQGQYLVMDFVEGQDLEEMVNKDGPQPVKKAIDWISQISDALDYLHSQKPPVIHRDIKPANIRIDSKGKAYLVDFGLVKLFNIQSLTSPGARGVTPGFSPPEQYGHGGTNALSDIYGLAATLYTLITGVVPPESVHRYTESRLQPAHTLNPTVPPSLSTVIDKGMALDPGYRFQNVKDFQAALKKAIAPLSDEDTLISHQQAQPIVAPFEIVQKQKRSTSDRQSRESSAPLPQKPSFLRQNKVLVFGGAFILLIVCLGLFFAFRMFSELGNGSLFPLAEDKVTEVTSTPLKIETLNGNETAIQTEGIETTVSIPTVVPTLSPIETTTEPLLPKNTPTFTPVITFSQTPNPLTYDLAFASDRDGEFSVYLMDTNTGQTMPLPRPPGFERVWWPSFCGTSLAVEAQDLDTDDQWIFLIDILSGEAERLSTADSVKELGVPRCSPGGDYLAYSAHIGEIWGLIVTDFSSSTQIIPENGHISGYASWPIQGTDFLFQVITQGDYKNEIYRSMGNLADRQYQKIESGANPSLSPDGSQMVYSCQVHGNNRTLCLANSDGSEAIELIEIIRAEVPGIGWNIQPASAWSADGSWIYFASAVDGDWDIYRIRPGGNDLENLTEEWGSSNEINPILDW